MTIEERMDSTNYFINGFVKAFINVEKSFDWDPSKIGIVVLDDNMFRIEGKHSKKFLQEVLNNYGFNNSTLSDLTKYDAFFASAMVQVFHVLTNELYSKETHLYQAIPIEKDGELGWELIFKFEHK